MLCKKQKASKRISVSTSPIIYEEKIKDPRKSEEKAKQFENLFTERQWQGYCSL